jgi:protein-S-isoprenylcysteine O-methyltransferase Ste14
MIRSAWHKLLLQSGGFFFRFRNFLFPLFVTTMFVFARPAPFLGRKDIDTPVVVLGFAVGIFAALLRLFVIGFAYIRRGGKHGRVYADDLVTQGIFAHVRNPMYLANILGIFSITIIHGSRWMYIIVIPSFAYVYYAIVAKEEEYLRGRFGEEYATYCSQVNRFVPTLGGITKTLGSFSYDWRKAVRKDYGTFVVMVVGCYAALLLKLYYVHECNLRGHVLSLLVLPSMFLGALYGVARYLKKSGKLRSASRAHG